jgi:FeS assembly SUF system protein
MRRELRAKIIEVLRTVYDPELPVNIWELGLVYFLSVDQEGRVIVDMTLTAPTCPVAESLPPEVELVVSRVPGVTEVKLNLVWDPPWDESMLSEAARLELGLL